MTLTRREALVLELQRQIAEHNWKRTMELSALLRPYWRADANG
jgi:hypothetical protein